MTGLLRTDLSTPLKAELAASALAQQGTRGSVSGLAQEFGVSRPTIYQVRKVAEAVLVEHFQRAEADDPLVQVDVDRAQLQRTIVALRVVAPNSIRNIEELLPIIYPGITRSFGTIQAICAKAEEFAAKHNSSVDLSRIGAAALDELFSQRRPVLAGVDLDTGFCFTVSLQEKRGGDQWAEVLQTAKNQGLELSVVVKDAALGIASGVETVFPEAEQRDDCFHALYEMGKVAQRLENIAYGKIAAEEKARDDLEKLRRTGKGKHSRQSLAIKLAHVRKRTNKAIDRYDGFVAAQRMAEEALHFVDLETAQLRTPRRMERALKKAGELMIEVKYEKAKTVGRYIINRAPGLAIHMKSLRKNLATVGRKYGSVAMRTGSVVYRLCNEIDRPREKYRQKERVEMLAVAYSALVKAAGERSGEVLEKISEIMQQRHRASSAIEGFNAGLRPYLYIHKGVSQGFLSLLQAYQNLRTRRWGRLKGQSAHEALTGKSVEDWLSVIGYPPSSTMLH